MHYLLEGALECIELDIIDIEEALLVLTENKNLEKGLAVRVLSEKLSALNTEKSRIKEDLN